MILLRPLLALVLMAAASGTLAQTEVPASPEETTVPGPPPPLPDLSEPNSRNAESLAEPGSGSAIPKTLRGSAAKAGGPANDLNAGDAPAGTPQPDANLANVLAGTELFHGNYCGAGQRGEGLPPTDDLDAACMRHDACYDTAGYASCACDRDLARDAALVADRPGLPLGVRRKALSVVQAAGVMACRGP
ncbi:hypothetical protein EKPJFOCH_0518 [Methylobacterium thuringiense]|uniref:Phospholipase A2 domain-containing protein n=2 Tax=Methylobacterium thuringiense TaxID=1003091 RepID=A0ABQ4TFG0_9HYPH|nr:hypothetical protein EKPJFOCH_0518 [Methylobacterium thuringiense]